MGETSDHSMHRLRCSSAPAVRSGKLNQAQPTDKAVSVRPGHSAAGEDIPQSSPNPVSRGGLLTGGPASAPSPVGGAMFRVRAEEMDGDDTIGGVLSVA